MEILIASTLMVAAFIPIYSAIRSSHSSAALNEHHVLARRRARRAMANILAHTFQDIKKHSNGSPPPSKVPFLPGEGLEVTFRLLTGEEEEAELSGQIEDLPFGMLDSYKDKIDLMDVKAYFYEFPDEPGLGRVAVHVQWEDPGAKGKKRNYVTMRFVEDPFHWRRQ